MKIGILGAANSAHVVKIVNKLNEKNIDTVVFSLPDHVDESNLIRGKVIYLDVKGSKGYYFNRMRLKKLVEFEKVDLLNAHYASGYGTLARIIDFHPMVLSVWGSDIYSFPNENFIKKIILMRNLNSADCIFSTSRCMADELGKLLKNREKRVFVTPFGVNINEFYPIIRNSNSNVVVIGFLKGTAKIYGIDIFLEIVEQLKCELSKHDIDLKVKICGGGDRFEYINNYIQEKNLNKYVTFHGLIPHEQMPEIINRCDIICIPSKEESFGVSAIEAMACGVPCVVSDAPGLEEVIDNGVTGYVISSENISDYVNLMMRLSLNAKERVMMGQAGRKKVEKYYNFENNIDKFMEGYSWTISTVNNCIDKRI